MAIPLGDVWHVSLVRGPVPVLVRLAGPGAASFGAVVLARRSWRHLAVAVAGTVAIVAAADWARRVSGVLSYRHPWSFHLWAGAVVFALVVVASCCRRGAAADRWGSAAMVVVVVVFAVVSVNAQYAYWPTLGDLAQRPLPHQGRLAGTFGVVTTAGSVERPPSLPAAAVAARVISIRIPATISGFRHRREWVWLPPAWFAAPRPQLPVLVMLAGTPGRPDDWLRAGGAEAVADAWAASHAGAAPMLIFPDHNGAFAGDTECVDGPRGRAETYLTQDVPRWAVAVLGASPDPTRWGVIGLSEGGTCALNLVLGHPDRFRTAVDLSGDLAPNAGSPSRTRRVLYGGDRGEVRVHSPEVLFRRDLPPEAVWLAYGDGDARARQVVSRLAFLAQGVGVQPLVWHAPGGHNFFFWSAVLRAAFPWAVAHVDRSPSPAQPANLATASLARDGQKVSSTSQDPRDQLRSRHQRHGPKR